MFAGVVVYFVHLPSLQQEHFYFMVKISAKPVTSNISMIVSFTFLITMLPCLFITFCAASKTRSPAEERYSSSEKSKSRDVIPSIFFFKLCFKLWCCDRIKPSAQRQFHFVSICRIFNFHAILHNAALQYLSLLNAVAVLLYQIIPHKKI